MAGRRNTRSGRGTTATPAWTYSGRLAADENRDAPPLRLVKKSIDEYLERRRLRRLAASSPSPSSGRASRAGEIFGEAAAEADSPPADRVGRGRQQRRGHHDMHRPFARLTRAASSTHDYDVASAVEDDEDLRRFVSAVGLEVEEEDELLHEDEVNVGVGLDVAYAALTRRRVCRVLSAALDGWSWCVRWGHASADAHW